MVVGFNHNVRYRDQVFHIQTEDSGLKSPHIVTLLYVGGTILASRKTSYADIAKVDNLDAVVEELMKEQHKGMLRALKNGEYDAQIDRFLGRPVVPAPAAPPTAPSPPSAAPAAAPSRPPAAAPARPPAAAPRPAAPPASLPTGGDRPEKSGNQSLDDIILSYLVGEDDKP